MALIICESFDGIGAAANLAGKWTAVGSMTLGAARNGNGIRSGLNVQEIRYALNTAERDDYLVVGFAYKRNTFDQERVFLELRSDTNATIHVQVSSTANAGLWVRRGNGGTVYATSPNNVLQANVFHYIELGVRLSDSTSDFDIRVDGVSVLQESGPFDTKNGGTSTVFDNVAFQSTDASSQLIWFDDVYILNEQTLDAFGNASNAVDFLGDCRVEALQPNGNGNSSQFVGSDGNSTDNYLLVDDVTPDDDTTYVQTGVDNEKDTYAFENLASTSGSVVGVQVVSRAKKTDLGTRLMAHVARSAGTELDSPDYALSTAYGTQRTVYENEPNTSVWTRAEVDAAEFGVKARS